MKFSFLILFLFYFPQSIFAFQNSGFYQNAVLEVTVIDQSSALIPNVIIRLKKGQNIIAEKTTTDSQKIVFSIIKPDKYILEVEATGFKKDFEEIDIKPGTLKKTILLEIAELVENVTVQSSSQEKNLDPRDGAFTNFLTKAEIEALPDDPVLLKQALKQKFGDDAEFIVDSFNSSGLPRKSEIASIKVNQSSFDAEYHKIGTAIIEITSKPASRFFGFFIFDFNDESLNSRQTLSAVRTPEQDKNFGLLLWGPLKKDTISFFVTAGRKSSYNSSTVIANLPNEEFSSLQRSSTSQWNFDGKLTYNPSQFQTVNLAYSFSRNDSANLGVGEFNLPDRAFNLNSRRNQIRYSQIGNVGKIFYNEFRFQYIDEIGETAPVSDDPAIIVLDAFNKGSSGNEVVYRQQNFSIADNFLWGVKNHALKIGGLLDYEKRSTISSENRFGTFTFSSLTDFISNHPSVFTQDTGNRNVEILQVLGSGFIQDDIRVSKSLMMSLGLRYEVQNNLKDKNNFSPRIGFAWSPTQESKITVRGGVGLFYNWLESNTLTTILSRSENQPGRTIIINPGFPNPLEGGKSQILPENYWLKDSNMKAPSIFLAQVGVQRQISATSSLRMQYSYQKGFHQFRSRDINAPLDGIRPNTNLGQILQFESSAFFVRNSVKIDFNTAPTKTTYLSVNYTLAKSISDANGFFGLPSDNYNLRLDRSVSNNDQRHNLHTSFTWALPKNLRFSTVFHTNSPLPYTITTGNDDNGDTVFNDRPSGILRNSERGVWQKQFDASLSWQINLGKNNDSQGFADPNSQIIRGKTIILDINSTNIFNQTNFQNYAGVQTSPFFRQPISAGNPRRINIGLKFSF